MTIQKIDKKIMIVEDDEALLTILKNIFSLEGFEVFCAKDGLGAIKMAEKEKPDFIISDVLMPKMSGLAMAKEMKKMGMAVPTIFLTNVGEQEREVAEFDYFTKSETNLDELVKKIKEKIGVPALSVPQAPIKN